MTATRTAHARSLRDYRHQTLVGILRDLKKNPVSYRKGSWEFIRLAEIEDELKRRKGEEQ